MSNPGDFNAPIDPLLRLASFRPPRDLTLGGMKPNKKVFVPNLNVTRKKNNPSPSSSRDVKKEEKVKKDRKSDRNKNFKNGPKIIKTSGIFSEGLGSVEGHHSRVSYLSRSSEPARAEQTLQKPTLKMEKNVKIDYDEEEQKIRAAYGGDWYDAEPETFSGDDAPVRLPPNNIRSNTGEAKKTDAVVKQNVVVDYITLNSDDHHQDKDGRSKKGKKKIAVVKKEVVVKEEPLDSDDDDPHGGDNHHRNNAQQPVVGKMFLRETEVSELLKSDKSKLIFLQMPDILPGRGGDDGARRRNDEPTTSEEASKPDNRCRLKDLKEGRIGTMRIHRSGKVTMLIGDTAFEVSSGISPAFRQEVVSVAVDDPSKSANIISLGDLDNKLDITPNWDSIFEKMSL